MGDLVREDEALNASLHFIGEFEPIIGEKLDAVILVGIVRGRDDHPGIGTETPR